MWNGSGFHDGWGWMGSGAIGMGLIWIVVIVVLALLLRGLWPDRGRGQDDGGEKSALDILRERYARGEIDRAEFERKRRDLSA
jgi:putative membrane protein